MNTLAIIALIFIVVNVTILAVALCMASAAGDAHIELLNEIENRDANETTVD